MSLYPGINFHGLGDLGGAVQRPLSPIPVVWRDGGIVHKHRFRYEEPSVADIEYLEDRLYEFNEAATGISDGRSLGVFLRDAAQIIVAAAAGHTWGGTCELRQIWVAEPLRRQGIGRSLLAEAEAEAVRRGCSQLVLTTHSFQAPQFYQKLGFTVVSEVPGYPCGHSQVVLRKPLEGVGGR